MRTILRCTSLLLALGLFVGCGDDDGGNNVNNVNNTNSNENTSECGNGAVESGEQCDQGVANSDSTPDACRTDCRDPYCQDGVTDTGEACDDGNSSNNDGCLETCVLNVCGDGHVDETPNGTGGQVEACDDPDPNVCRPDCGQDMTACGNGDLTDQGEACDDGIGFNGDNPNTCRANCQLPSCGDGVTDDLFSEECDDATQNGIEPSGCLADCTLTICGDGYLGGSVELCDSSNLAGETCVSHGYTGGTLGCYPDGNPDGACDFDITGCFSECGNGIAEAGEQCDGTDLRNVTCATLGTTGGTMTCMPGLCLFDFSGCYTCGDGDCEPEEGETTANCPTDCNCGDGVCERPLEDSSSCAVDCDFCDGGSCDEGNPIYENSNNCPLDCPCLAGYCFEGDTAATCPAACSCGNGQCDADETTASCPADCARSFGQACWTEASCGGVTSLPARCRSYIDASYDMPLGFCTGYCLQQSHCAAMGGWCHSGDQVCLKPCTDSSDCRQGDGYFCQSAYGGMYCLGPIL